MNLTDKVLSSPKAADFLGLSPYTLRRARCDGKLHGVALPKGHTRGNRWFYRVSDLNEWLLQFDEQSK